MKVNITQNRGFIERTQTVTQYFAEVRKFKLLSQEEEKELFEKLNQVKEKYKEFYNPETNKYDMDDKTLEQYKNECAVYTNRIAESNQRFVISAARHYAPNDKFLDCVSEGTLGLMEAIDKYDIHQSVRFITYAVHYIHRNITQYLRGDETIRKTNISKTFHIVSQAKNEFIQLEEREPTSQELMEYINLKEAKRQYEKIYGSKPNDEEVEIFINGNDYKPLIKEPQDVADMTLISIDEPVSEDENDSCVNDLQMFNDYSSNCNEYETVAENDYNKSILQNLFDILTPRERKIISMSFGIGYTQEYDPKEIAVEIGLTAERIRQMKKSIIEKLQNEFIKRNSYITKR